MRERNMAVKTDINRQGWEKSDFPTACQKCYGENPYMRILKQNYGQECRICFRPFTVFKWKGDRGIYKRTCVCSTCSKTKNICQVCTLDLEFGLPMEVRDKRCGENGKYLLNENFMNENSKKIKPPPPPGPPPAYKNKAEEKQTVYVPQEEEDSDQEDANKEQKNGETQEPAPKEDKEFEQKEEEQRIQERGQSEHQGKQSEEPSQRKRQKEKA